MSTKIEYADLTLNPGIYGCSPVSAGCTHCYAAKMAHRQVAMGNYPVGITTPSRQWTGKVVIDCAKIEPAFDKLPKKGKRILLCSMTDLFQDGVPFEVIERIWLCMARHPQHLFYILTKRIVEMEQFVISMRAMNRQVDLPNVYFGVTIEHANYLWRLMRLNELPVTHKWLSFEPLLGSLGLLPNELRNLDFVAIGGETGPDARPMKPEWAEEILASCEPYKMSPRLFFKHQGEWAPGSDGEMKHVGKAKAGRLLGGRTLDELPPLPLT